MATAIKRRIHDTDAGLGADQLKQSDFSALSDIITNHTGIRLPPAKRLMVEGRLRRRVRALGLPTMSAYCDHILRQDGLEHEFSHLINAVTTNKTDFFREPEHFDVLERICLPTLLADRRPASLLKVWSAASSTGAEAYTLAMVLATLSPRMNDFRYFILGTDISTEVLQLARRAIYAADLVRPVHPDLQKRFLMRSTKASAEVRIVPELRRLTRFEQMNLMDETYPYDRDVDIIFLRNVLIYFDKKTQSQVLRRLLGHLRPGGYLFLGHSESMIGTDLQIRQVAPAVFQKT